MREPAVDVPSQGTKYDPPKGWQLGDGWEMPVHVPR